MRSAFNKLWAYGERCSW